MTAIPPHHAAVRPCTSSTSSRARTTRHLARFTLALTLLVSAPAAAHAAQGGVTVATAAAPAKTAPRAQGAQAETTPAAPAAKPRSVSKNQLRRAQTLLRVTATGSNDTKTRKVVKRFQGLRGITTHGIVDVPTYLQIKDAFALLETGGTGVDLGPSTGAESDADEPAGTTPDAAPISLPPNLAPITPVEQAILDTIAACESEGDPTAISRNGLYRGKYQFDRATWKTVGGTGDPAEATELEQDQRAAILLRQRGTAPWPVCGRNAA